MPSYRTGVVSEIIEERTGLQRVRVELGGAPERAYVLTQLTGPVMPGDRVVVNTTAVELGLGTGGWHVVHWNLEHDEYRHAGPGHIMKARYTSLQADVGSTEELEAHAETLADASTIEAMPVVVASLHSQIPGVVVALKHLVAGVRIAYVMTDGAALPLALSDLVDRLVTTGLVDTTITTGHAFGGDHEAVSVFSALAIARHVAHADVAVVAMGPGVVGTGTRLGHTGIETGPILDAVVGLAGRPVATLRASFADPRPRHRGVSHHSVTALTTGCRSRVCVALPAVGDPDEARLRADLAEGGVLARHDVVAVKPPDIVDLFSGAGLDVRSMGRRAHEDPILHLCAAASGTVAADLLKPA